MSRAAVLSLLRTDTTLATLEPGIVVNPEYSLDQRPSGTAPYITVCWRTTDFAAEIQDNGADHFELWVHLPIKLGTDFGRVIAIIDRCDDIFKQVVEDGSPVVGADGRQLDYIGFEGRGIDFTDEGPQTICKSASYYALSSKV
jgi:hypothetical protein